MKKYKNVTSRHLQFFYAKIELAPGEERNLKDEVIEEDPGLKACIEFGDIEVVGGKSKSRSKPKAASLISKNEVAKEQT